MSAATAATLGSYSAARTRATPQARPYQHLRRTLGDPTPLACTVAKTVAEAVLGGRGLDTLVRWLDPELRMRLERQRSIARRAGRSVRGPINVRKARVSRVSATAAEVSVVVDDGHRCRAVAMRLEDVSGRWLVTECDVV